MGETYYEVLGVAPDASSEEIERAYRERVLETHPDHNDDPDAVSAFSSVTTAADVLTDETERTRYDRLGHDAYCRETDETSTTSDSGSDGAGRRGWPDEEWWEQYRDGGTSDTGADQSGPSHHARQRARRDRRARDRGDWFGGDGLGSSSAGGQARSDSGQDGFDPSAARDSRATDTAPGSGTGGFPWENVSGTRATGTSRRSRRPTQDGFGGYVVNQWDDDVELGGPFRTLDRHTLVFGTGIALLYPILVYATITSYLPWPVNVVVGCCTLVLIGYLLTIPQIALGTFGTWSVLASVGVLIAQSVTPFSLFGLAVLAGFWVPFGYAVAVWWVLRP